MIVHVRHEIIIFEWTYHESNEISLCKSHESGLSPEGLNINFVVLCNSIKKITLRMTGSPIRDQ